jgi:Reverse transcriptase (RNA-dependent DNA polymerase)
MHENRKISSTPWSDDHGRSAKVINRTADMHVPEKSDCAVQPVNRPNKGGQLSAEAGEGRAQTKENIVQSHMHSTQSGKRMSQGLDGVRKAAKERKQERFTALLHHLNVVRYADDLVVGFQHRTDAERFLREFRERLAKFGLELHPDKTRLIEFGRFAARDRKQRGEGKPETFTFLGFTHYCGQRHKSGTFTVGRITAKKRMVSKLKATKVELQRRMHDRNADVGAWLRKVVLGYYQYHAVPGNTTQLRIFKLRVSRLWQSVLVRRSQRAKMCWERFT